MTERQEWPVASAGDRLARSRSRAAGLRAEIASWIRAHRPDHRFVRFSMQFDTLDAVFGRMLAAIDTEMAKIAEEADTLERVHECCRDLDERLGLVRRTHRWYADKYDQRSDDRIGPTLRAADEIVRSCWSEPFRSLGITPPTGPLVYLEPRYDAMATPRISVPADLRAPSDAVVGELVRELPVPVVALPLVSVDEPWWLVLCAHETGHHVQTDLAPGLPRTTREALFEATAGSPHWHNWAQEAFADAFSVLMVGPAAAWAVDELQYGRPARMARVPQPGDRYPPPAVRTALLGELGRFADLPDPGLGVDDVRNWLAGVPDVELPPTARSAVSLHLDMTAAAARALIDLQVDGIPLRVLCGYDANSFGADGKVSQWATALTASAPVITGLRAPSAARLGIAGGVAAYRQDPSHSDLIRGNLADQLTRCGPPGYLSVAPVTDLDDIAERLTDKLLTAPVGEERD